MSVVIYDAADFMDGDNYVTVLESFVNILLQAAQVNTKKLSGLDRLVLLQDVGCFAGEST